MDGTGILINGNLFDFEQGVNLLPAAVRNGIAQRLMMAPPVRHAEPTVLLSLDDDPWHPSQRLFELGARIAMETPAATHPLLSARAGDSPRWFETFPGEHYHLLTTLCHLLEPRVVWEFGTDAGMGTVALLEGAAPETHIYTVDIDPWTSKTGPWLTPADFASGRVTQIVSDMQAPELFSAHSDALAEADLIFVDGPKDGATEASFLAQLATVRFRRAPIVVLDDIRFLNMLQSWRSIARPKIDMISYGHWTGTGLVDWCAAR